MFKYHRENEIQTLHKELEKYNQIGNEATIEERLANLSISKKEAIKKIEAMIEELQIDKQKMQKAHRLRIQAEATAAAQKEHKAIIEEYHLCMKRIVEIGMTKGIVGDFNLNDYTDFNGNKSAFRSAVHMSGVGVERINRQTEGK